MDTITVATITAAEARDTAVLAAVYARIKDVCERPAGNRSIEVTDDLTAVVRDHLKANGYRVNNLEHRSLSGFEVHW